MTLASRVKKGIISIPNVVSKDPHQNSVTVDMVNSNKSSIVFPKNEDAFIFLDSRDVRNCSKETANNTIHAIYGFDEYRTTELNKSSALR